VLNLLYIIHLVPLVHERLFVCRNFGKNTTKYTHRRQVDVAGGPWAHMSCQPVPPRRRPTPQVALPCHWSVGETLQGLSSVYSMSVWSIVEIGLPWIYGPIVIHLEELHRLNNRHSIQIFSCAINITAFEEQPRHYDQVAVHLRVGRCPLASPNAQGTPHHPTCCLQVPPLPLHTIKGGVELGGQGPIHFQAFQVLQAL
jgi:hypothetical protein